MMKRTVKYIFAIIAALPMMAGCQKVLEFETDEDLSQMSINAIISTDTAISVSISKVFGVNDLQQIFIDNPDYFHDYFEEKDSIYDLVGVIKDARVSICVNGVYSQNLVFDENANIYRSTCVPKAGDKIDIVAESDGMPPVTSSLTMPFPIRLDIVESEKIYSKRELVSYTPPYLVDYKSADDTVMRIKLRIHDVPGQHDFYRLKIRSVGDISNKKTSDNKQRYYVNDVFQSSDVIFIDEMLTDGFGGWKEGFSNVFDDRHFDGCQYEFVVESRQRKGNNTRVYVELETITQELYYYLKSVMLYRISKNDIYTESVQIEGNVEGGFGIFGGFSSCKHLIYF